MSSRISSFLFKRRLSRAYRKSKKLAYPFGKNVLRFKRGFQAERRRKGLGGALRSRALFGLGLTGAGAAGIAGASAVKYKLNQREKKMLEKELKRIKKQKNVRTNLWQQHL